MNFRHKFQPELTYQETTLQGLGAQIRNIREARGMSREELARRVGMSARQLRDMENGAELTATTLVRLADALGVPITSFRNKDEADSREVSFRPMMAPDEERLLSLYRGLRDKSLKKKCIEMVEGLCS